MKCTKPPQLCGLFLILGALAFTYVSPLFAFETAKKTSPEETFQLRQRIVQARYEADQHFLRGQRQSVSTQTIYRDLRPGDILLVRSTSFNGSVAARTSEVPGQFSHLLLIAQDPRTQELKTIESDQSTGVVISKVTPATVTDWVRVGLFRYKDSQVAKKAAERLLVLTERRLKSGPIHYDNHMDLSNASTVYCTEIATWAFKLVGVQVPESLSEVKFLDEIVRKDLELKSNRIFTPQDLEIDPRFTLVREWRRPQDLQEIYFADAVLGKYFSWLAEDKEKLKPGIFSKFVGALGKKFFAKKIADRLGEDTSDKQRLSNLLQYGLTMLTTVSNYESALKKELYFVDTRFFTVSDYDAVLEKLRLENRLQGQSSQGEDSYYGR
jgi:hypothetical protein